MVWYNSVIGLLVTLQRPSCPRTVWAIVNELGYARIHVKDAIQDNLNQHGEVSSMRLHWQIALIKFINSATSGFSWVFKVVS